MSHNCEQEFGESFVEVGRIGVSINDNIEVVEEIGLGTDYLHGRASSPDEFSVRCWSSRRRASTT